MPELPFVSVVMPIRNEAAFIERSLSAVLGQDYPHDRMEVLAADGMSTDGSREIIARVRAHADVPIALFDNPGHIAPTGLNAALLRASGDIIVRVDGHCIISRDYISQCVSCLIEHAVEGVGGPIETIGRTPLSTVIATAMSSAFGVGGSAFRTVNDREMLVDTVAFPGYTRQAIRIAGFFDEELVRNQDDEYNYRLREAGGQILLNPNIRSRYYSRATLGSLWKQYFQYGFWKVRVMQKHPRQMQLRQFAPPAFAATLLASTLLALISPVGRILLTTVGSLYILANLAASVWTARKHGWRHLFLLPMVFAALHLSYGTGFLVGLARFWNRWGDKRTRIGSMTQSLREAHDQTSLA